MLSSIGIKRTIAVVKTHRTFLYQSVFQNTQRIFSFCRDIIFSQFYNQITLSKNQILFGGIYV